MEVAAEAVRSVALGLERIVADLIGDAWSGADADRALVEWQQGVTQRLLLAAEKLDGVGFDDLVEGRIPGGFLG